MSSRRNGEEAAKKSGPDVVMEKGPCSQEEIEQWQREREQTYLDIKYEYKDKIAQARHDYKEMMAKPEEKKAWPCRWRRDVFKIAMFVDAESIEKEEKMWEDAFVIETRRLWDILKYGEGALKRWKEEKDQERRAAQEKRWAWSRRMGGLWCFEDMLERSEDEDETAELERLIEVERGKIQRWEKTLDDVEWEQIQGWKRNIAVLMSDVGQHKIERDIGRTGAGIGFHSKKDPSRAGKRMKNRREEVNLFAEAR
jgi:hypothetical protein